MTKQEVIDKIKSVQSEEELSNLLVFLSQQELDEVKATTVAKWLLPLALMYAPSSINVDAAINRANKKIVRTAPKSEKQQVEDAIKKYTRMYRVDERVIRRMLQHESSFSPSNKDYDANVTGDLDNVLGPSYGPGQIKVVTAREIYSKQPESGINANGITANTLKNNIDFNIKTMCKLMGHYYKQFAKVKNNNKRWALAATAYNRGITKTKKMPTPNIYGKSVAMKENKKSLFKEFMTVSSYINYNDIYSRSEVPVKTQLQTLLSNLPDEDQLMQLESDLKTLKLTMQSMKFESPSMDSNVNQICEDVFTIRQKLREVVMRVSQMNRDLSYDPNQSKTPLQESEEIIGLATHPVIYYKGKDPEVIDMFGFQHHYYKWNNLEKGKTGTSDVYVRNEEDLKKLIDYWNKSNPSVWKYDMSLVKEETNKWKGLSSKYSMEELVKKFGKEKIKQGAKVEMEHTKDIQMAMRIACDHLIEKGPDYYDKLKQANL